jgi:hypothetical protein
MRKNTKPPPNPGRRQGSRTGPAKGSRGTARSGNSRKIAQAGTGKNVRAKTPSPSRESETGLEENIMRIIRLILDSTGRAATSAKSPARHQADMKMILAQARRLLHGKGDASK